jgi:hypothetical protein
MKVALLCMDTHGLKTFDGNESPTEYGLVNYLSPSHVNIAPKHSFPIVKCEKLEGGTQGEKFES